MFKPQQALTRLNSSYANDSQNSDRRCLSLLLILQLLWALKVTDQELSESGYDDSRLSAGPHQPRPGSHNPYSEDRK